MTTPPQAECDQCHVKIEFDASYPTIEWDDDSPDTVFCSTDCAFDWMTAVRAVWQNPNEQPDI